MITLDKISKSFAATKALHDVSLTLKEGSCFGLVGPNGAGKSTLIKIMLGILQQDKGTIDTGNRQNQDWKETVGYVPQEICLHETLTVEQNLTFFAGLYGYKGKALQERINQTLAYVGLETKRKAKVTTFSGGMKRRLHIGCALIHEPKIILMDEPTVGIDPQSRNHILQMINDLKQANHTILYSSHYMEEVQKICDDIAFLDEGKVLLQMEMAALIEQHRTPTLFVQWQENYVPDEQLIENGDVQPFQRGYKFEYNNPLEAMEQIVHLSREHALTLEKLEWMQPSLEEIFFHFTGKELRGL